MRPIFAARLFSLKKEMWGSIVYATSNDAHRFHLFFIHFWIPPKYISWAYLSLNTWHGMVHLVKTLSICMYIVHICCKQQQDITREKCERWLGCDSCRVDNWWGWERKRRRWQGGRTVEKQLQPGKWKVKVKTRDISHKVAARKKNNSNLKRSQGGYLEEIQVKSEKRHKSQGGRTEEKQLQPWRKVKEKVR